MGWDVIAQLIISNGLPLAEMIWQKWSSGNPPSAQDWADLKALSSQTALDRAKAALARKNIPLDSEQAKAILALIPEMGV